LKDYRFHFAWQRPTLAGETPQLPSALKSLTSVFGMGTGVTSSPSSPDLVELVRSKPDKTNIVCLLQAMQPFCLRLSPRSISIRQLHASPHFHPGPIHLIFFEGSYLQM